MISAKRVLVLRIMVCIILFLLAVQFELGMAVNLAGPPTTTPLGFSVNRISIALYQAGGAAVYHAGLGILLVILSVITLVRSLRFGSRSVKVFGSLAFLATVLAAINGLLFVQSGFQGDGYSHGMATGFILSFGFYFLELYSMKPVPTGESGIN